MAMMTSLQRRLDRAVGEDRERQFFSHSLAYLHRASGEHVTVEDWAITTFDVEFGPEIGSGSL